MSPPVSIAQTSDPSLLILIIQYISTSPFSCTAMNGEYWRLLTPGVYEVMAAKSNYIPQTKTVQVEPKKSDKEQAKIVNFQLKQFYD